MILLCGEYSIKRLKIYLEIIRGLSNSGYDIKQIYEFILTLEKKIISFYTQNRNISKISLSHFSTCEKFKYIEMPLLQLPINNILSNGKYSSEMTDLFDNNEFDITRIDELDKLLNTLVKYRIEYAQIGDPNAFLTPNYFLSTIVPNNFENLWDFNPNNKLDCVPIFKTYSNQEILYKNINEIEEYCNGERNSEYHYLASFKNIPKWEINGVVQVHRDKSIYYGSSSPHTHFNFRSTSLYINPNEFPTCEELYSISQVKSLKLQIKK